MQINDLHRTKWFPVAVLPGASTFTMNFTSGKFDAELFALTNATEYEDNTTYAMPAAERHEVNPAHYITLLNIPVAGSVYINGLEETETLPVEAGKFQVDYSSGIITFNQDEDLDNVEVIYDYQRTVREAIITNKESAIGECAAIWPVYGSGDDCSESAIIGYYVVRVFRARITTLPGLDTSLDTLREAA